MRLAQGSVLVLALVAAAFANPLLASDGAKSSMGTVYLVLLKKGPAWGAKDTPESKAIQDAHMANIKAMWQAKKLILAGPVGGDGDLRGIFLLQVGSLEEAKALAATDPAVKAGALTAEVLPWWVETRVLPEAGKYCQSVDAQ